MYGTADMIGIHNAIVLVGWAQQSVHLSLSQHTILSGSGPVSITTDSLLSFVLDYPYTHPSAVPSTQVYWFRI